jgi:hypothetical protein
MFVCVRKEKKRKETKRKEKKPIPRIPKVTPQLLQICVPHVAHPKDVNVRVLFAGILDFCVDLLAVLLVLLFDFGEVHYFCALGLGHGDRRERGIGRVLRNWWGKGGGGSGGGRRGVYIAGINFLEHQDCQRQFLAMSGRY